MCDLCNPVKKTKWYHMDKDFLIIDCDTCNQPMLVTKEHTMTPSDKLIEKMMRTAKTIFGENISFRKRQRKIKDHFHWHIEKNKSQ